MTTTLGTIIASVILCGALYTSSVAYPPLPQAAEGVPDDSLELLVSMLSRDGTNDGFDAQVINSIPSKDNGCTDPVDERWMILINKGLITTPADAYVGDGYDYADMKCHGEVFLTPTGYDVTEKYINRRVFTDRLYDYIYETSGGWLDYRLPLARRYSGV